MLRTATSAAALALLIACGADPGAAEQAGATMVPPITPAADEIRVQGVAAFGIHLELQQCLKDASDLLSGQAGGALHVQIGPAQRFFSQSIGYVLRADFTRDDVSAPLINRIVCWHTGEVIASRISAPPLSQGSTRPVAVPGALRPQH